VGETQAIGYRAEQETKVFSLPFLIKNNYSREVEV